MRAGGFKFDIAKDHDVGGVRRRFTQFKFHFSLAQDGCLIRGHETDGFIKTPDAGGPTVKNTEASSDDGQLWHAEQIDDADNDEISIGLLSHVFAQQGALEVR